MSLLRRALTLTAVTGVALATAGAPALASGPGNAPVPGTRPAGMDAGPGAGYIATDNVEYVTTIPVNTDSAGARILGKTLYVTDDRGLTTYDISVAESPRLLGFLPLPQQAYFVEEDPDTNGKILLVGTFGDLTAGVAATNKLNVIDVSNPAAPALLSSVAGGDSHTTTCVLSCTWAYNSNGQIIDLRDPRAPRVLPNRWYDGTGVTRSHDVTEVAPGLVVTSSNPVLLLDARRPEAPKVLARSTGLAGKFLHGNLWPREAKDRWLLVGGETSGNCRGAASGGFHVLDASTVLKAARDFEPGGSFDPVSSHYLTTGQPTDGNSPYDQYCAHWFTTHPTYANGGLVAMGWYEHGTRFLDVAHADGKVTEKGWFLPLGGSTSAAYWVDNKVLYSVDYQRGIDVLRFTGKPSTGTVRGTFTPRLPDGATEVLPATEVGAEVLATAQREVTAYAEAAARREGTAGLGSLGLPVAGLLLAGTVLVRRRRVA